MKKEHSQKDAWFLYALALVFITLKLTGFISWLFSFRDKCRIYSIAVIGS